MMLDRIQDGIFVILYRILNRIFLRWDRNVDNTSVIRDWMWDTICVVLDTNLDWTLTMSDRIVG